MASSFGVVEDKIVETEFFLCKLLSVPPLSSESDCYFSAFVSAARSVTFALQASMKGVDGFNNWYTTAQEGLKADSPAPYFVEIRNDSIHRGLNPLNRVGVLMVGEYMANRQAQRYTHFLTRRRNEVDHDGEVIDASQASESYFCSLLSVVYDCYENFNAVVDPQWYFTEENFARDGKTLADATEEQGFPVNWLDSVPEEEAWRLLRNQQPSCLINDLFECYLNKSIKSPS